MEVHVEEVVVLAVDVDLIVSLWMKIHLETTMDILAGTEFLKKEMMASPLKDVHMVDHVEVGVSVVVVVVASAMETLRKVNALGEHLSDVVGLDVGKGFTNKLSLHFVP